MGANETDNIIFSDSPEAESGLRAANVTPVEAVATSGIREIIDTETAFKSIRDRGASMGAKGELETAIVVISGPPKPSGSLVPGFVEAQVTRGGETGGEIRANLRVEVTIEKPKGSRKQRKDQLNRAFRGINLARKPLVDLGYEVEIIKDDEGRKLVVDTGEGRYITVMLNRRDGIVAIESGAVSVPNKKGSKHEELDTALEKLTSVYEVAFEKLDNSINGGAKNKISPTVAKTKASIEGGSDAENVVDESVHKHEAKAAAADMDSSPIYGPEAPVQPIPETNEALETDEKLRQSISDDVEWIESLDPRDFPSQMRLNESRAISTGSIISVEPVAGDGARHDRNGSRFYRIDQLPVAEGESVQLRIITLGEFQKGELIAPDNPEIRTINLGENTDGAPLTDDPDNNTFLMIEDGELLLMTGERNENIPAIWHGGLVEAETQDHLQPVEAGEVGAEAGDESGETPEMRAFTTRLSELDEAIDKYQDGDEAVTVGDIVSASGLFLYAVFDLSPEVIDDKTRSQIKTKTDGIGKLLDSVLDEHPEPDQPVDSKTFEESLSGIIDSDKSSIAKVVQDLGPFIDILDQLPNSQFEEFRGNIKGIFDFVKRELSQASGSRETIEK